MYGLRQLVEGRELGFSKQVEGLNEALASERSEKARLGLARENLQADIAAMRAHLQQLSRELAYHRSAPGDAQSGQLNSNEVATAPSPPFPPDDVWASCMCSSQRG